MIIGCALVMLIALYILDKKHNNYVVVYEGTESTIREAMEVYWVLKGRRIRTKYEIPYNIKNLYTFSYYESPVRITVPQTDEAKAKEALRDYRAEKRKITQNIAHSRGCETPEVSSGVMR